MDNSKLDLQRIVSFAESNPRETAMIIIAVLGCASSVIRLAQSMIINKRSK